MKIRALAGISGPMGNKDPGDEFVVDAATGAYLIESRAAEEVVAEAVTTEAEPETKTSKRKA